MNPDSVILLDEPDAHLEILRQREIYGLLSDTASDHGTQIIVASHSEVLLNEAAERGKVVAFVGAPHLLNKKGEVLKALKDIGFDQYFQAENTGFILYLEGSTDLAILRAFAGLVGHPAETILERPFVYYVGNQPKAARRHFYGLSEAKPDLVGIALFDRLERDLEPDGLGLLTRTWPRREIENYLLPSRTLERYARQQGASTHPEGSLFAEQEAQRWAEAMKRALKDQVAPAALRDEDARFWIDVKISDDLLSPVFASFFGQLGLDRSMRKGDFYRLVSLLDPAEVHLDVIEVLDEIVAHYAHARPMSNG